MLNYPSPLTALHKTWAEHSRIILEQYLDYNASFGLVLEAVNNIHGHWNLVNRHVQALVPQLWDGFETLFMMPLRTLKYFSSQENLKNSHSVSH